MALQMVTRAERLRRPERRPVKIEWISGARGLHQLFGSNAQKIGDDVGGQLFAAEEAGKGRQEDQEREERKERPEGDIAGKRYRLIGKEPLHRLPGQRRDGLVVSHPSGINHPRPSSKAVKSQLLFRELAAGIGHAGAAGGGGGG